MKGFAHVFEFDYNLNAAIKLHCFQVVSIVVFYVSLSPK
jgi:hypothetical protein